MANRYNYKPPCSESQLVTFYASGLTQAEIAQRLGCTQKRVWKAMQRFGISSRKAAKRDQRGEKNASWKGDAAGKQALHRRLYAKFGKPSKCGKCGTEVSKAFDYANLTGRYEDESDYMPMCRSCHATYDHKHRNFNGGKGGIS